MVDAGVMAGICFLFACHVNVIFSCKSKDLCQFCRNLINKLNGRSGALLHTVCLHVSNTQVRKLHPFDCIIL